MTSRKDEQFFASLSKGAESGPPAPEKPPKWLASKCPADPEFCLRAWKAVFLKRPNIDNWPQAVSIWKSYVANPAKVEEIEKSFADAPKPSTYWYRRAVDRQLAEVLEAVMAGKPRRDVDEVLLWAKNRVAK